VPWSDAEKETVPPHIRKLPLPDLDIDLSTWEKDSLQQLLLEYQFTADNPGQTQQHRQIMVLRIAGVLDRDPKYSALSNVKALHLPEVRLLAVHKRMLAHGKKLFLSAKEEQGKTISVKTVSVIRSRKMGPRRVGDVCR